MRHPTLLTLASVALLSLTAACGDDSPAATPDTTVSAEISTTAAAAPETTAAVTDTTAVVTESTDPASTEAETTTTVPAGEDSCTVNVTGDVNTSWTSGGGYSSVNYGAWIPPSGGSTPIALDDTFFVINCTGPGASYVGFAPSVGSHIPYEPATYTLPASDNLFGGSSTPSVMEVLMGLDGTDTNWGPSAEGTLVITEFDENHIAGTFTIPIKDVLGHLNEVDKGTAMITGEFNYQNPNG